MNNVKALAGIGLALAVSASFAGLIEKKKDKNDTPVEKARDVVTKVSGSGSMFNSLRRAA